LGVILGLIAYLSYVRTIVGLWQWSGLGEKTLWNWLEIGAIPLVLAIGGYLFCQTERNTRLQIAANRAQDNLLQGYVDGVTEMLLDKGLRTAEDNAESRTVARARTLTVLRGLDAPRKGILLRFLHESNLIRKGNRVIDLFGADLSDADLSQADLRGADLRGVNLFNANLSEADLRGSDLRETDLRRAMLFRASLHQSLIVQGDLRQANLIRADLRQADLRQADLRQADLIRANMRQADLREADLRQALFFEGDLIAAQVTPGQLQQARSLERATMPDGAQHS
jgi:uncharacterized protein YjbI with pentapeptide repeats